MDIKYSGSQEEVIDWLYTTISPDHVSTSRRTGFDKLQRVLYGVYTHTNRVYILDEKYAVLFILRWS